MEYPEEVKNKLDVLNTYKEVDDLSSVNIIHLYPENELAYPDGYYDSRFFQLLGFNTETMEKCNFGRHDGMSNYTNGVPVVCIRIFADGSTFIKFDKQIKLSNFQDVNMNIN